MADCDRWLRVAGVLERARRNDFSAVFIALLCAVGVSLGLFCSVWRHGISVMAQVQSTF